ncbi:MAG: CDP-alcohol phosphatidyltransferase family protein [Thermoleophilia bacterium]
MSTPAVAPPLSHLPNALTIARIVAIPVFVVVMLGTDDGHSVAAAVLFAVAGFTDQIDGWLARRWRVESEFGKYADPLADRLMIDAAVVLLWHLDRLPWPGLLIILVRDVVLVAGSRIAVQRGYEFSVSFLGKCATWVLYAAMVGYMISPPGEDYPVGLFWGGVGLALAAAAGYVAAVLRSRR